MTTMRRAVVAVLVGLAGLTLGGGCGEACATSCSAPPEDAPPPTVLVGKLVGRSGNVIRIEAEGGLVDVRVIGGHPRVLDTGDTYRVPISQDEGSGVIYSSLPSDCDCDDVDITEEDGDAVDQSAIGFSVGLEDLERMAAVVLGAFVAVGVSWAGVRRVRGRP